MRHEVDPARCSIAVLALCMGARRRLRRRRQRELELDSGSRPPRRTGEEDQGRDGHRHRRPQRPRRSTRSAYKGLQQAKSELGVDIRVADVEVQRRLRAEPLVAGAPEVRPRDRRRLPDGRRDGQGRQGVPADELRDHRLPRSGDEEQAQERRGLLFKENEAGYLVGYMAGLYAKDKGGDQVVSAVGGQKIPPVDALHRGLPGRRQEGQPGRQDADRLLAGLRRPGEVQGDRAQPDRARARRSSSRSRASAASARSTPPRRRTSRASASTPTRPTSATSDDLGAEEGRRRRVRRPSRTSRTGRSRPAPTRSSTSSRAASASARSNAAGQKFEARGQEGRDQITSGEITDIPTEVGK